MGLIAGKTNSVISRSIWKKTRRIENRNPNRKYERDKEVGEDAVRSDVQLESWEEMQDNKTDIPVNCHCFIRQSCSVTLVMRHKLLKIPLMGYCILTLREGQYKEKKALKWRNIVTMSYANSMLLSKPCLVLSIKIFQIYLYSC